MRLTKLTTMSMIALAFSCLAAPRLLADSEGTRIRWDIIQIVQSGTTFTALAGGLSESKASFQRALASGDNSTITLTGSGTFELGDSHAVTGGGTWETVSGTTRALASGTYRVTQLVSFVFAPGDLASAGVIDGIGNNADSHAGLAVMKVTYSDGDKGILVVVCSLPPVTPVNVVEGTTATKGFVDYADPLGTDPNIGNTVFHVVHHQD